MKNVWFKRAAYTLLGAAGGFSYYFFVGCTTGSCPITSNPYISTAYGALIGMVFTMNTARKDGR
jgi:hypothetical protein